MKANKDLRRRKINIDVVFHDELGIKCANCTQDNNAHYEHEATATIEGDKVTVYIFSVCATCFELV